MALCVVTGSAFAQGTATTAISGHVSDSTGAVVPGATVHLVNNGTGAERTATTDDSGGYSIPNLPPANYKLRVEKQGFKTSSLPSVDLLVGQTADGSVTLSVGDTSETVEVSTLPPQLQTSEATVGQVIDQKQVNDLPLNGRNVLQLATLAAGVSPAQTNSTGTAGQYGNRSLFITVDGGRASSTNYVLDGTYVRSIRFNNLSLQPNTDTIQEFNLLRSTFSTEYGQGDAIVSMVTKSGTNQIHGTVYEFTRSQIFDARNFFSSPALGVDKKPVFHRNQFGGTLGFPIIKDHVFVFGGYEGQRSSQGRTVLAQVPDPSKLVSANYQLAKALTATYPVPNIPGAADTTNNFQNTANIIDDYDQYTIRADETLSAKHSIFERYINYDASQFQPAVQGGNNYPLQSQNAVFGSTYLITPTIVNDFRIGYNRVYAFNIGTDYTPGANFSALEGLTNVTALTTPSQYGRSTIAVQGYTNLTSDGGADQGSTENVYSIGDSVSDVIGHHTIKFGFQFQWRQIAQLADNNGRGSFTFNSGGGTNPLTGLPYTGLENYLRGFATAANAGFGSTSGHYRDNTYGIFFNDIWQITPKLTFNYGLRWEYNSPFVEQNGLEGAFDPASGQIAFNKVPANIPPVLNGKVNTNANFFPAGIIQPDKRGFGPRIGISYQAAPSTVIRAGYGIFFDNVNANELQFTRYAAPLYYQLTLNNVNVANADGSTSLFPGPDNYTSLPAPFSTDAGNRLPYSQEWTASIQQDLGHGTIFEIAYTGSATRKLWKRYDQNEDILRSTPDAYGIYECVATCGSTAARPFQNFAHGMLTTKTDASATFHGMSVKLEQRGRHGLYYLGNYQWSKNLDNNSGEVEANDTAISTNFSFDRSRSRLDVRHRATISAGYELPFGKNKHWLQTGVGNAIAGGWSIQPALQFRSGYPFTLSGPTPTFGTYVPQRVSLRPGRTTGALSPDQRSYLRWYDVSAYFVPGNSNGVATTPQGQGNVPRNAIDGPGTAQIDFSAIKNFKVWERVTGQFRAEAFNIINHPNFGMPVGNVTAGNAGQITQTSNDNRDLQFALKFLW
ncbi:MAG TPA: TonB-dependent receptor [Granulicella sp.]